MLGHGLGGIDPHAEKAEPAEELHQAELQHGFGHVLEIAEDLEDAGMGAVFGRIAVVARIGFRIVFAGEEHGDEDAGQEEGRTDIEGIDHVVGHLALRGGGGYVEDIAQRPGQPAAEHGADADQEGLDAEAQGALFVGQVIGHEGAEGFHGDVDAGVHQGEENSAHEQGRFADEPGAAVGQDHDGGAAEQGSGQEIGLAPAEPCPGLVAEIADERLHEHARERGHEPEPAQFVHLGAIVFKDAARIAVLQSERALDAHESKAHPYDLRYRKTRFLFHTLYLIGLQSKAKRWKVSKQHQGKAFRFCGSATCRSGTIRRACGPRLVVSRRV